MDLSSFLPPLYLSLQPYSYIEFQRFLVDMMCQSYIFYCQPKGIHQHNLVEMASSSFTTQDNLSELPIDMPLLLSILDATNHLVWSDNLSCSIHSPDQTSGIVFDETPIIHDNLIRPKNHLW